MLLLVNVWIWYVRHLNLKSPLRPLFALCLCVCACANGGIRLLYVKQLWCYHTNRSNNKMNNLKLVFGVLKFCEIIRRKVGPDFWELWWDSRQITRSIYAVYYSKRFLLQFHTFYYYYFTWIFERHPIFMNEYYIDFFYFSGCSRICSSSSFSFFFFSLLFLFLFNYRRCWMAYKR